MRVVRLLWRLPAMLLLCIPVVLLTACGRIVPQDAGGWLRDLASRAFGRGMLAIAGGRLSIEGSVPHAPYALVCNHLGYLDVVVLLAALSRPRFVSKAEVRDWPLLGPLARLGGTIFLQRQRRRELPEAVSAMQAALHRGDGIVFFPEGTSSGGEGVLPFHASLFEPLARLRIPLRCASLRYVGGDGALRASEWLCWWRDMPFGSHFLRLISGPGFEAQLRFASDTLVEDDRKRLAAAAESTVRSVFRPTLPPEESLSDLTSLLSLHFHLLGEAQLLVGRLSDADLAVVDDRVGGDGVGVHLRHVIEFYDCLLVAANGDGGTDYDSRRRDPELERSCARVRARLVDLQARLHALPGDRPMRVIHDRFENEEMAGQSSLARELRFVASHTVHHFAMIAMLLRLQGHEIPEDFGVAPSTLSHRRRVGIAST